MAIKVISPTATAPGEKRQSTAQKQAVRGFLNEKILASGWNFAVITVSRWNTQDMMLDLDAS